MNWILAKKKLSGNCIQLDVSAPEIVASVKYGQSVLVRFTDESKSLPLIVADFQLDTGRLSILVTASDSSQLHGLTVGDEIAMLKGPFGDGFDVDNWGDVLCVVGGAGIPLLYPLAKALAKTGICLHTILVADSEQIPVLENELKSLSSKTIVFYRDEEQNTGHTLCDEIAKVLLTRSFNRIFSIGDVYTLKESFAYTNRHCQFPSTCYLNTIGSSTALLKGIFKVTTCHRSKYVSVDGYNFSANYSSFEGFIHRFYPESTLTSMLVPHY